MPKGMPNSNPHRLLNLAMLPWLVAMVVQVSLVGVVVTAHWRTLPSSEKLDAFVPTIRIAEASPRRFHTRVCGPFGGSGGRVDGGRSKVTGHGCRWPTPTARGNTLSLLRPVSVADSLAVSDTWGRDVDLPVEVTRPYRNEAQDLPIEPFRAGVTCVFHSQADRGPGVVSKFDPLETAQLMMPGLQSVRDVIREQIGGQAFFRRP